VIFFAIPHYSLVVRFLTAGDRLTSHDSDFRMSDSGDQINSVVSGNL